MKKLFLLLISGLTFSLNAQIYILDVRDIRQKETKWCWAATAQCVLDYYGHQYEQCQIVDYARTIAMWINFGTTPCCEDATQGCNRGTYLCEEEEILHDVLVHFGNISNSSTCTEVLQVTKFHYYFGKQRPLIIGRQQPTTGHVVVAYGIEWDKDKKQWMIFYMDPAKGPEKGFRRISYDELIDDGTWKWIATLVPSVSPYPDHCYDCKLNGDEVDYDCGGSCPPCKYAPEKVIINNSTSNLPAEVRALSEITAGNAAVKVLSGQNVDFITAGEINLLPGFEVEAGANFNTKIKSNTISLQQICGKYCKEDVYGPIWAVRHQDVLKGFHLVNVSKIEYKITNLQSGRLIYENVVYVDDYGEVVLWDLIEGESSNPPSFTWYSLNFSVYGCDGNLGKENYYVKFSVSDFKKSIDDESYERGREIESDPPPQFSPQNDDNIIPQNETITPHFSILPNPNAGTFQLETNFSLSDIDHLKITNTVGTVVYESQFLVSNEIQLQNTAPGLYFVVMVLKEGMVLTQKVMVQR